MRGIKRTLVSLQRGLSSYWLISLLAPCMSQAWAQGDAAVSPRHQFQHSNGIWWGWERAAKNAEALQSFYLVDQGSLDSARTGTGQSQVTSVNYSLGDGPNSDFAASLTFNNRWSHTIAQHQLNLNLLGDGEFFRGSTVFAGLEDQFRLTNGIGVKTDVSQKLAGELSLLDRISLAKDLDLSLGLSRRDNVVDASAVSVNRARIDTADLRLEQRWRRGGWQASLQNSKLSSESQAKAQSTKIRSTQNISDTQARVIYPLISRIDSSLGWQELRSHSDKEEDDRVLRGPEIGLIYSPFSNWNWNIQLRSLSEESQSIPKSEIFGVARLEWRKDAHEDFVFLVSRQVDLLARYQILQTENIIFSEQQKSITTNQLKWNHSEGRHLLSFSLIGTKQKFETGLSDSSELQAADVYNLTRLATLNLSLSMRDTRSSSPQNIVQSKLKSTEFRFGLQQVLVGTWRPMGGRNFVRVDASFESLEESSLDIRADRITVLLSIGQIGNF